MHLTLPANLRWPLPDLGRHKRCRDPDWPRHAASATWRQSRSATEQNEAGHDDLSSAETGRRGCKDRRRRRRERSGWELTQAQQHLKSRTVNGPGSGRPSRICSSVNLRVGNRSAGRASQGSVVFVTPSERILTCARATKGTFIVNSQKRAKARWNQTGARNIRMLLPVTRATRRTASLK